KIKYKIRNNRNNNTVSIDDKETYLIKYKNIINVPKAIKNMIGFTPKIIPAEVATALPPLKLANKGKVWPITANNPTSNLETSISTYNATTRGTSVAIVPFKISAKVTIIPAYVHKTLNAIVAPKLPLP